MRDYSPEVKTAVMAAIQNVAYVYGLRVKDEQGYFYVGSTKFDPGARLKAHLYSVKHGSHLNRHFANKVRFVGFSNVVCDTLEETDSLNRWRAEKAWIDKFLADGMKLVNRIHNDIYYGIDGTGIKSTTEQWERIIASEAVKGVLASDSRRQKIIELIHELSRVQGEARKAIREHLIERDPKYAYLLELNTNG